MSYYFTELPELPQVILNHATLRHISDLFTWVEDNKRFYEVIPLERKMIRERGKGGGGNESQ